MFRDTKRNMGSRVHVKRECLTTHLKQITDTKHLEGSSIPSPRQWNLFFKIPAASPAARAHRGTAGVEDTAWTSTVQQTGGRAAVPGSARRRSR